MKHTKARIVAVVLTNLFLASSLVIRGDAIVSSATLPQTLTNCINLEFEQDGVLPSSEGFSYTSSPGVAETSVFSVSGGGAFTDAAFMLDVGAVPPPPGGCTVVGWGDNSFGRATPPAGLSNVTAIDGGGAHSLALTSDGTVVGWGFNEPGGATPPVGLGNVVAISDGLSHSLALRSDGTVVGWGDNSFGKATPPVDLCNVVAISAAGQHSLALKSDGTVVGWGLDNSGQATPPAGLSNVTGISSSYHYNLALKSDGTVVGWGFSGTGAETPPAGLSNVTAISAGAVHSLALKSDGTVVGWGDNGFGEATPPAGLSNVMAISAGGNHSLALQCGSTNNQPDVTITGPANVWIGLKNSDDVGTKFDLLAEVLKNGDPIGSGQINGVNGGSSGFNNAVLRTINLALPTAASVSPGDTLSFRLSVRIATGVSGHRSGTARLWYNDAAANSRVGATIGGATSDYFLLNGFTLGAAAGPGPKKTIDVFVDRLVGGNPFKTFGTWSTTF